MLDPIDGTKSFITGMPAWGTLIALTRMGEPVYGMMHQPFTRERFTGDGKAAHYRGPAGDRDLHVRPCAALADAILLTTSPLLMKPKDRAAFGRVEEKVRLSRYGGDCYAYCMLAAGHVDLVIETELKPFDIVALIPIVTGAGGIITSWDGGPATNGGRIIAAGDARVHKAAMEMLRASPDRSRAGRAIRMQSIKQRRARHEGIERREELRAVTVLLHQQFVLGAVDDEMRAGAQPQPEFLGRQGRDDLRRARPRPAPSAGADWT